MPAESRDSLHVQVDGGRTLISRSPQLHRIWGVIQRVAPTDVLVPVMGDSTAKEIIGRLIHKLSVRARRLHGRRSPPRRVRLGVQPGSPPLLRLRRDEPGQLAK